MTISYVGQGSNAGTTVTIPTHQSGDLILIFAYRDGNNAAPSTPAAGGTVPTWTLIGSDGANTNSSNFRYAVATGSTTTSGTWTNATELICLVYRGTKRVGASAGGGATNSTSIAYPALTLNRTDNSSWVVGVAGHRVATNVEGAPTGMTNRASTGTEAAGHDTNGTVSSWSQQTVTVDTSGAWRSWTVELRDATVVITADAGSYALTGQAASLKRNAKLASGAGSFPVTGQDSALRLGRKLIAAAGSFPVTGVEPNLTYTPSTQSYSFAADAGSFTLSGQDGGLRAGRKLAVDPGSSTSTGDNVVLRNNKNLTAAYTHILLAGASVVLQRAVTLNAEAGSFTCSGIDVATTAIRTIYASAGSFELLPSYAALPQAQNTRYIFTT